MVESTPNGSTAQVEVSTRCPVCGQAHDDTVVVLAQAELSHRPSPDWLQQREWAETELAQLTADGVLEGQYRSYVAHALAVAKGELARRSGLRRYGAAALSDKAPFSPELIKETKRRVDLADLLGSLGVVVLGLHGGRRRYLCPVHHDTNPSGVIYENQGRWYCFGCNAGGDAIAALVSFKGLDFREAVKYLASYAGVPLPESKKVGKHARR